MSSPCDQSHRIPMGIERFAILNDSIDQSEQFVHSRDDDRNVVHVGAAELFGKRGNDRVVLHRRHGRPPQCPRKAGYRLSSRQSTILSTTQFAPQNAFGVSGAKILRPPKIVHVERVTCTICRPSKCDCHDHLDACSITRPASSSVSTSPGCMTMLSGTGSPCSAALSKCCWKSARSGATNG